MFDIVDQTTGRIMQTQSNALGVPSGRVAIETAQVQSGEAFYYDMAQTPPVKTARPSKPTLPATGAAIYTLPWSLFAAGSSVTVTPEFGQSETVSDPNEPLEFGAGTYAVAVDQPFPHHPLRWTLTVSAA